MTTPIDVARVKERLDRLWRRLGGTERGPVDVASGEQMPIDALLGELQTIAQEGHRLHAEYVTSQSDDALIRSLDAGVLQHLEHLDNYLMRVVAVARTWTPETNRRVVVHTVVGPLVRAQCAHKQMDLLVWYRNVWLPNAGLPSSIKE